MKTLIYAAQYDPVKKTSIYSCRTCAVAFDGSTVFYVYERDTIPWKLCI